MALAVLALCRLSLAIEVPWPAEQLSAAQNLTSIEGAGTNDFHVDLSGAFWNPVTRRLWVCRNGPGSLSKIWVVRENGLGGYAIDYRNGLRGEWTGFGDLEDITQANLNEDTLYVIVEGEERIKEYDVSIYGVAVLRNIWNTTPYLPLSGGSGSEGLCFVPDASLHAAGFVNPSGQPYTSQNGMGGLMFVAHQNGGRVYVFDLNRFNSSFNFVGSYRTGYAESAALAFDRESGLLFILHGAGYNRLEVTTLASTPVGPDRRLHQLITFGPPPGGGGLNMEGIALVSDADCDGGGRSFFLTIDDGGPGSLYRFREFPCSPSGDMDGNGVVDGLDIERFITLMRKGGGHGGTAGPGDMNMDGTVDMNDLALFIARMMTP